MMGREDGRARELIFLMLPGPEPCQSDYFFPSHARPLLSCSSLPSPATRSRKTWSGWELTKGGLSRRGTDGGTGTGGTAGKEGSASGVEWMDPSGGGRRGLLAKSLNMDVRAALVSHFGTAPRLA